MKAYLNQKWLWSVKKPSAFLRLQLMLALAVLTKMVADKVTLVFASGATTILMRGGRVGVDLLTEPE